METKVYIDDKVGEKWKETAMKRFGYGRGSISKAAEEALKFWITNEERIENTISKLKAVASKERKIEALLLFGTYARKEIYNDIDVTIVVAKDADKVGIISKCSILAPEYPKFDFSIFNDMPINIKSRILSDCKIIYARQGFDMYRLSAGIIQDLSRIKPMLDAGLVWKCLTRNGS